MTVKELINNLKQLPEDYKVEVPYDKITVSVVTHLLKNDNRKTIEILPEYSKRDSQL